MTKLFWVLYLSSAAFAAHISDKNERISYGYDTDIRDAKYYAFFTCANILCGATLVTTTRLITAAHCVINCQANDVKFYMGMNSRSEVYDGTADQYGATAIHMHPRYPESMNLNYDIAVIYVDGEVATNDRVEPISYALTSPPLNDYIMCLGYGATETGQGADVLQRSWFLTKRYEDNMLLSNAEQTSVLPGDSGGPCVYNNQFIGDISAVVYVNGETFENIAVMTGTDDVLSFIRSHGL